MIVTRVKNVIEKLTFLAYNYVCLGIFVKHKLTFSLHMTVMIMELDGEINQDEYDFFLKGNTALEGASVRKPFAWFPEAGWKDLDRLVVLNNHFSNLRDDIANNEKIWREWYDLEKPEESQIPMGYD